MSREILKGLDENVQKEIVAIATASLMTWDMLGEEEQSKYASVEEFTGFMVLRTAHDIVTAEENEEDE